jgi:uncharacterized Zn finger protein
MTTHDKSIATKAAAIIAERRIKIVPESVGFNVVGSNGDLYRVTFWGPEDATCTCEAGRRNPEGLCSHALAGLRMAAAPGHFE